MDRARALAIMVCEGATISIQNEKFWRIDFPNYNSIVDDDLDRAIDHAIEMCVESSPCLKKVNPLERLMQSGTSADV